jgi:hypothetical protein
MFAVQQYDYNIKIWVMLVVICIFGFAMVGMSSVALRNDQGSYTRQHHQLTS